MSDKHYVGEAGTSLRLDTGVLVGSAAFSWIKYRDPSGVEGTWTSSLFDSYSSIAGATGTYFLSHTLETTDLSIPGEWRFHALIGAVDGTWLGEMVKVQVFDEFE